MMRRAVALGAILHRPGIREIERVEGRTANCSGVFAPDIGFDRISCHYRDVIVRAPECKVTAVTLEQLE